MKDFGNIFHFVEKDKKKKKDCHSRSVFKAVCGVSCRLQRELSGLNTIYVGGNVRNVTRSSGFSCFSLLDTERVE